MEYDYHGTWEGYTGHNAPLFSSPKDDTPEKKLWNIVSIFEFLPFFEEYLCNKSENT